MAWQRKPAIPLVNSTDPFLINTEVRELPQIFARFSVHTMHDSPVNTRRPAPQIRNQIASPPKRRGRHASVFSSLRKHGHMNFCLSYCEQDVVLFFLSCFLNRLWRENRGSVTRLKWKQQCTLSSTIPASKQPSITPYRQSSRYCTWSRVSESPFSDSNCLKILSNTFRRWFLTATWLSTLSAF